MKEGGIMRKKTALIAILVLVLCTVYNVDVISASIGNSNQTQNEYTTFVIPLDMGDSSAIRPYAYEVCNGYSYHNMYRACYTANLYCNGKLVYRNGNPWQCSRCNEVIITEGDPSLYYPQKIGRYGTRYLEFRISDYTIWSIDIEVSNIKSTSSSSLSGYVFN